MSRNDGPLDELLRGATASATSQLVVLRDGELLWALPGQSENLLHTASVTKVVVGLAVGRAVALGFITSIDDYVSRWLSDWRTGPKSRVRIRHLMGHTSGLSCDWQELIDADPQDFVAYCRAKPVTNEPGELVAYNNGAVMVLTAVVAAAVGRSFLDFVRDEVLDRIDVDAFDWLTDRAGNPLGMSGLQVSARSLAQIGQVLLIEDHRILPRGWVNLCLTQSHPSAPRFGLSLFRYPYNPAQQGFGHDGSGGQQLWIYPAAGIVIARLRVFDDRVAEQSVHFPELASIGSRLS